MAREEFVWREVRGGYTDPVREVVIDDAIATLEESGTGLVGPLANRNWCLDLGYRTWQVIEGYASVDIQPPEPKAGNEWRITRATFKGGGTVRLGSTPTIVWSGYLADFKLSWATGGELMRTKEIWRDSELEQGCILRIEVDRTGIAEYLPLVLAMPFICPRFTPEI